MTSKKKKPLTKEKIKETLKINSETGTSSSDLEQFMPIVEMIARKEFQTSSSRMISYEELVNTGLIAVNKLIKTARATADTEYNSSYIAQSVKWAMKDEMRSRQSWYSVKKTEPPPAKGAKKKARKKDETETTLIETIDDARKAVFEVIMSVEGLHEEAGYSPADQSPEVLENLELLEMKENLKKAIKKLPDNLRQVIELRFYENMSGNEVAAKLGVTASRISHMINEAVKKLRVIMTGQGY